MDEYIQIIFGFWVILCFASWTYQTLLVRRMKKNHHEKWMALGEPMEVFEFFRACLTPSVSSPFGGSPKMWWKNYRAMLKLTKYLFCGDAELDADKNVLKLRKINMMIVSVMILIFVGLFISAATCFQCS